ncbi:hypothetical protein ABFS82_14G073900 [Erythranthe guttata]|uniref:SURP motif domain-containing protein n=1 Tax=Erythranthe guttata TaxID=4155 RepID=A0A022RDQ3_ERYGU|nr:hypothetical protein MIMGU_mgv1a017513mg [Erythranthe guttata]
MEGALPILPPPDIRMIVDKTARYVVKNGPEFEQRIISSCQGTQNFSFLHSDDPYHAYYKHRISEARAATN